MGIGIDGSGSIRVTSHFLGVAGLCPSWGTVSTAGAIPLFQNNGPFLCAIGPMARRIEDPALVFSVSGGWDHRDPFTRFMKQWDAIVCPVSAFNAMLHETTIENYAAFSYPRTTNLTGAPGAIVRCGTSHEKLPVGVQIIAPKWRDDIALAVADYLEQDMGGWKPASPAVLQ